MGDIWGIQFSCMEIITILKLNFHGKLDTLGMGLYLLDRWPNDLGVAEMRD